jgi:F-type H+-transporting ATPase subunit b
MFLAEASIQLVPDGTLLLHLLMVAAMVVVLNRTLLKPINKILADREKYILGRVEEAKDLLNSANEKRAEYQASLKAARTEGYHLLERERAQAVKDKDEKIKNFREETKRMLAREIEITESQENQVRSELETQAESISALITKLILKN